MIDTKLINKAVDVFDDNFESSQEAEDTRTERHRIDMASDNPLSKNIRPYITIYSGLIWGVVHILSIWFEVNDAVLYSASAVFGSCIGFYFNSKRQERIVEKKSAAGIKLELMKQRQINKEARHNRRSK